MVRCYLSLPSETTFANPNPELQTSNYSSPRLPKQLCQSTSVPMALPANFGALLNRTQDMLKLRSGFMMWTNVSGDGTDTKNSFNL